MSENNQNDSELLKKVSVMNETTKSMFMFLSCIMIFMNGNINQYMMDMCRIYYTYPLTIILLMFMCYLYGNHNINSIPTVYDFTKWVKNLRVFKYPSECKCS